MGGGGGWGLLWLSRGLIVIVFLRQAGDTDVFVKLILLFVAQSSFLDETFTTRTVSGQSHVALTSLAESLPAPTPVVVRALVTYSQQASFSFHYNLLTFLI